jgi:hypothetical protein
MQPQPLHNNPQSSVLRRVVAVVRYEYVGRRQAGHRVAFATAQQWIDRLEQAPSTPSSDG